MGYQNNITLSAENTKTIEKHLRRLLNMLGAQRMEAAIRNKHNNTTLNQAELDHLTSEMKEINEILGKIHNNKIWTSLSNENIYKNPNKKIDTNI